jgi:PASTA domain-containing protein
MCALACVPLLAVGGAQAETITLGSSLTKSMSPSTLATSATLQQTNLPGATLVSPFDGQITSWRITGATGGPWILQVLHPAGGGLYSSTGSSPGTITGTGLLTFTASLPVKAGDSIGIQGKGGDSIGTSSTTSGALFDRWSPPLSDGGAPRAPTVTGATFELGFNTTVVSNCIVPKVKGKSLKKAKSKLIAAGCVKGKVKKKGGKRVTKQSPAAGTEVPPGTAVKLTLG